MLTKLYFHFDSVELECVNRIGEQFMYGQAMRIINPYFKLTALSISRLKID